MGGYPAELLLLLQIAGVKEGGSHQREVNPHAAGEIHQACFSRRHQRCLVPCRDFGGCLLQGEMGRVNNAAGAIE